MRNLSKKSGVNTRLFPIHTTLQVLSLKEGIDYSSNETRLRLPLWSNSLPRRQSFPNQVLVQENQYLLYVMFHTLFFLHTCYRVCLGCIPYHTDPTKYYPVNVPLIHL